MKISLLSVKCKENIGLSCVRTDTVTVCVQSAKYKYLQLNNSLYTYFKSIFWTFENSRNFISIGWLLCQLIDIQIRMKNCMDIHLHKI